MGEPGGQRDQSRTSLGFRVDAGGDVRRSRRRRGPRALRHEPRSNVHRLRDRLGLRARVSRDRRLAPRFAPEGCALRRQHRRPVVLDRRPGDDSRGRLPVHSAEPGGAPTECSAAPGGSPAASAAVSVLAAAAPGRESAAPAPARRRTAAASAAAVAVARSSRGRGPGGVPDLDQRAAPTSTASAWSTHGASTSATLTAQSAVTIAAKTSIV